VLQQTLFQLGNVMADFSKGWNKNVIIGEINNLHKSPDGKLTSIPTEITSALSVFVDFDMSLVENEKISIIVKALSELRSWPISENDLKKHLTKVELEYLRRPLVRYYIATSISIRNDQKPFSISIDGIKISISPKLNRKFNKVRKVIEKTSHDWENYQEERDFSSLLVEIQARSVVEAMEKGLRSTTYFRGVLNYYLNSTPYGLADFKIRSAPINKIRVGRIHTIHTETGENASRGFWYEHEMPSHKEPYSDSKSLQTILGYCRILSNKVNKSGIGSLIKETIIKYCEALDISDPQSAFLRMWAVAEYATGKPKYNDTTIDRIAVVFDNQEYIRAILQKHRKVRNSTTHSGSSNSNIKGLRDELQWYIGQFITFLVWNSKEFCSEEELMQFLDLHQNIDALSTNLRLTKKMIKFRTNATK